jgi:hypothetical protein
MTASTGPGSAHRYVLLGLASGAPPWMPTVDLRLADLGTGHEFLPCAGIADLLNRLASGRPFSALLVDHRTVGLDRELISRARSAKCPVLIVGGDADRWTGLGATGVLPDDLAPDDFVRSLERHARPIGRIDRLEFGGLTGSTGSRWTGRLVAVTGPGGTGASTIARSLAHGLASDPRLRGSVTLVDVCLEADQAILHGVADAPMTLQEATQAHRGGLPGAAELDRFLVSPAGAPYRLLPGIRRRRDWPTIGGSSLRATLTNLCRHNLVTVVDVDPDVDLASDEQPTGPSTPGEPALAVCDLADIVVVVGRTGERSGRKGGAALGRTIDNLLEAGLPEDRLVPWCLADTPDRPHRTDRRRARASMATHIDADGTVTLPDPGPDPEPAYGAQLARILLRHLDRLPDRIDVGGLVPIVPGSLGTSSEADHDVDPS